MGRVGVGHSPLPWSPWAVSAAIAAVLAWYAVAFDQGLLLAPLTDALRDSGGALHELFHDARHLLGVPCH
ncbi:MAG TPA: hypothetical protein VG452_12055 [Egibacteraceae bacterium]|nr:hypothetical protein [Egibacteraceae bacterium]